MSGVCRLYPVVFQLIEQLVAENTCSAAGRGPRPGRCRIIRRGITGNNRWIRRRVVKMKGIHSCICAVVGCKGDLRHILIRRMSTFSSMLGPTSSSREIVDRIASHLIGKCKTHHLPVRSRDDYQSIEHRLTVFIENLTGYRRTECIRNGKCNGGSTLRIRKLPAV